MNLGRRGGWLVFLLAVSGLRAGDVPDYTTLAGDAFRRLKELQQAGQLPGVPPDLRVRVKTRGLPVGDTPVTFPVAITLEVGLPDAPTSSTFVLTKSSADAEWRLSDQPPEARPATNPPGRPAVGNPPLREELLARVARDQAVREDLIKGGSEHPDEAVLARMNAIDAENIAWLTTVVAAHGLPGPELVGRDGAEAAFLLVQHAEFEFQQQMLPLVREAYAAGKLSGGSYALLLDRVLVRTGKPQVYGTQTKWKDHVLVSEPIDDPDHVDERRAEVGLAPLAEYLRRINETHHTGAAQ